MQAILIPLISLSSLFISSHMFFSKFLFSNFTSRSSIQRLFCATYVTFYYRNYIREGGRERERDYDFFQYIYFLRRDTHFITLTHTIFYASVFTFYVVLFEYIYFTRRDTHLHTYVGSQPEPICSSFCYVRSWICLQSQREECTGN